MEIVDDSTQDQSTTIVNDDADEKRFVCHYCTKTFTKRPYWVLHTRIHTGEKPYHCLVCDKRFCDKSGLNRHSMLHTGEKPYACDVCLMKFTRPEYLEMHIMKIHNSDALERPFSCDICYKKFPTKGQYRAHARIHTDGREKPYSCSKCNKSFYKIYSLTIHLRKHTGEKPFTCNECGKKFADKSCLASHIAIHDIKPKQEKHFLCVLCDKTFLYKQQLERHFLIHTGEKQFTCTQCNRDFSRKDSLDEHVRLHNNSFVCTACNKKFPRKIRLDKHVCKHDGPTGEKPLVCLRCDNVIKKKYDLNKARNPFVCVDCNTRLSDNNDTVGNGSKDLTPDVKPLADGEQLSQEPLHEESSKGTHLPEKPFVCVECRESFPEKIELGDHYRITHNVCAECNTKFSSKYPLNIHFLKHIGGKKQFVCTRCDKKFNRKDRLDDHMKTHSEGTKYSCDTCDMKFLWKSHLTSHVQAHMQTARRKKITSHSKVSNQVKRYRCQTAEDSSSSSAGFDDLEETLSSGSEEEPSNSKISAGAKMDKFNEIDSRPEWEESFSGHDDEKSNRSFPGLKAENREANLSSDQREIIHMVHLACAECEEMFPDETSLEIHQKRMHARAEKPFSSEHSKEHRNNEKSNAGVERSDISLLGKPHEYHKNFTTKYGLKKHPLTPIGEKQTACTKCDEKFYSKDMLDNHYRIHYSSEKQFSCPDCNEEFEKGSQLARHILGFHARQ